MVVGGAREIGWGCEDESLMRTVSFGFGKHDLMNHEKWRELQLSLSLSEEGLIVSGEQ